MAPRPIAICSSPRNRDQQELWYFGVPGVYTPNEQFMASLFGFFHFKQAMRPSELAPDARFGYWSPHCFKAFF